MDPPDTLGACWMTYRVQKFQRRGGIVTHNNIKKIMDCFFLKLDFLKCEKWGTNCLKSANFNTDWSILSKINFVFLKINIFTISIKIFCHISSSDLLGFFPWKKVQEIAIKGQLRYPSSVKYKRSRCTLLLSL